ncbi:NAD(P)-binding domain-containing protein [Propioniciclava sinopodophylli]|uniref:NAD(P)-binding domain-containing protein n=1 Tax=Propioniciclava sinopodophylli TaxID=1837344 RepID=UPI001F4FBAF7|nr:NAD(P)-binding domain-containing protein [Propioniciclava sinopodophylli]
MVPAGRITDAVIGELGDRLSEGDIIIDGGNSKWTHDQKLADELAAKGIRFIDCGVSGGVWGLENGRSREAERQGHQVRQQAG